jgi:hypothetical protein
MAKLNDDQRRALQVLARERVGCAEVALLAEGFSVGQLATLAMDGFAKRKPIVTNVGGREDRALDADHRRGSGGARGVGEPVRRIRPGRAADMVQAKP